ncbi:MAG: ABC transporter permease [Desulfovermiculus sp.]|nr:ABC transporter permease [Desulfovermiculus sp.]
MNQPQAQPHISDHELRLSLSGDWLLSASIPDIAQVVSVLDGHPEVARISFNCTQLNTWDSTLLTYIFELHSETQSRGQEINLSSLPRGVGHLLHLATSSSASSSAPTQTAFSLPFTARLGATAQSWLQGTLEFVDFLGQGLLSLLRLLRVKSVFRTQDLLAQLQFCGAQALPIISLISILVGLILAFVGAVQLKYFGAQIYVADLVGIAMTREMGAMMTGIIMAGRTGAAFAAQIGTMQVNEEIDALHTLGISPFDFLVLPRILALVLMMPLLCLYADLMGILGGAIVGMGMLDLSLPLYWNQTMAAITLPYVWLGVAKSCVFGFIIAFVGCLRGLQAGRSAQAVGQAATSAVVTTIVGIIVIDGLFAVVCDVIGI